MVIKSHPILIVLLSSVSTSATRLILRLLTPCKKKRSHHHKRRQGRDTQACTDECAHARTHTSADSDGYNHCQEWFENSHDCT